MSYPSMKGLQFGIKEQNIALKVSQKHDPDKNLGGLAGLALGIRYDLVHEDPQLPALREIEDILLSHIKKNRQRFYRRVNKKRRGLDKPPRKV